MQYFVYYSYYYDDTGLEKFSSLREAEDFIRNNLGSAKGDLSKFTLIQGRVLSLTPKTVVKDFTVES